MTTSNKVDRGHFFVAFVNYIDSASRRLKSRTAPFGTADVQNLPLLD